jgi:hypothetical protein
VSPEIVVATDLTESQSAERLVADTVARYGRLDILVNNAGIINVGPLDHMAVGDFEASMATHFLRPLHTMLAAIPLMRAQKRGRIVNISSIGGKIGVPHLVPYCASKFALTGFSTAIRAELARDGMQGDPVRDDSRRIDVGRMRLVIVQDLRRDLRTVRLMMTARQPSRTCPGDTNSRCAPDEGGRHKRCVLV